MTALILGSLQMWIWEDLQLLSTDTSIIPEASDAAASVSTTPGTAALFPAAASIVANIATTRYVLIVAAILTALVALSC